MVTFSLGYFLIVVLPVRAKWSQPMCWVNGLRYGGVRLQGRSLIEVFRAGAAYESIAVLMLLYELEHFVSHC